MRWFLVKILVETVKQRFACEEENNFENLSDMCILIKFDLIFW